MITVKRITWLESRNEMTETAGTILKRWTGLVLARMEQFIHSIKGTARRRAYSTLSFLKMCTLCPLFTSRFVTLVSWIEV